MIIVVMIIIMKIIITLTTVIIIKTRTKNSTGANFAEHSCFFLKIKKWRQKNYFGMTTVFWKNKFLKFLEFVRLKFLFFPTKEKN